MKHLFTINVAIASLVILTIPSWSAQPLNPTELDTINFTHVLFQWTGEHGAVSYHLQIAQFAVDDPFDTDIIYDMDVETNAIVIDSAFTWGTTYLWRYWSVDLDGNNGDTSITHQFSIMAFDDDIWTIETDIKDLEGIAPGVTIFGFRLRE